MVRNLRRLVLVALLTLALSTQAWGWSAMTHYFIALEAGISFPESACFPDLSKNDNNNLLGPFHWHNAAPQTVVTPDYIDRFKIRGGYYLKKTDLEQEPIYVKAPHPAGVLYYRICELYKKLTRAYGWQYDYYITNIAHYVADLSQPLHNFPYGEDPASDGNRYAEMGAWAKRNHGKFDSAFDRYLPLTADKQEKLRRLVAPPAVGSSDDLKRGICTIANSSIALANKCYSENRKMTEEEVFTQVARSISLLKAVKASTGDQ